MPLRLGIRPVCIAARPGVQLGWRIEGEENHAFVRHAIEVRRRHAAARDLRRRRLHRHNRSRPTRS